MVMAVAVGLAIGAVAAALKRPGRRMALVVARCSSVTRPRCDDRRGAWLCAAVAFSLARYFAPWRPIPVAPIGFGFLSIDGALIALVELGLFFPPGVRAMAWPCRGEDDGRGDRLVDWRGLGDLARRARTPDAIKGLLLREDTSYATGFSETTFRTIRPGLTESEVRGLLGSPHQELWFYASPDDRPPDERPAARNGCLIIGLQADSVVSMYEQSQCAARGISAGLTRLDLQRRLGPPLESCWRAGWSPAGRAHRLRKVCFANGTVHLIVRKWAGGGWMSPAPLSSPWCVRLRPSHPITSVHRFEPRPDFSGRWVLESTSPRDRRSPGRSRFSTVPRKQGPARVDDLYPGGDHYRTGRLRCRIAPDRHCRRTPGPSGAKHGRWMRPAGYRSSSRRP